MFVLSFYKMGERVGNEAVFIAKNLLLALASVKPNHKPDNLPGMQGVNQSTCNNDQSAPKCAGSKPLLSPLCPSKK